MPAEINVEGLRETLRSLKDFPKIVRRNIKAAGEQASDEILNTRGLRNYPPETDANRPPTPYYIRGRGTQYASGNKGNSERYGSQWRTTTRGYTTTIGNRASYARHVGGERQARAMGRIGWRKLVEVGREKVAEITRIYSAWVERAKRKAGL